MDAQGVGRDLDEATRLFRISAFVGSSDGMVQLGRCFLRGHGVVKDRKEALDLFRKAVGQGNGDGKVQLGICLKKVVIVQNDVAWP